MYPVAFRLGPLAIHTYPLVLLAAVVAATALAHAHAPRLRMRRMAVNDLGAAVAVGGLVGARLWHAATFPAFYALRWWRVFALNTGGLVFYGAVAGALVAAVTVAWIEHLSLPAVADLIALGLPLGCAIGRVGCLAAGCCGGPGLRVGSISIPPQLVDSAAQLLVLGVVLAVATNMPFGRGAVAWTWLALYPMLRFGIECLRDEPHVALGMTQAQLVSVPLAMLGVALSLSVMKRGGVRWMGKAC